MRDTALLIPAAGRGERLNAGLPKALCELAGTPLLVHAVRRALLAECVAQIVIAAPSAYAARVTELLSPLIPPHVFFAVVPGGTDRQASVRRALAACAAAEVSSPIVLVHDAARALTPAALFDAVAAAVRSGHCAVVPTMPVVDTVRLVDDAGDLAGVVDRDTLRIVQTPQGFELATLLAAHRKAEQEAITGTDDATLVEHLGQVVHSVPGSEEAMKITHPRDLALAGAFLEGTA